MLLRLHLDSCIWNLQTVETPSNITEPTTAYIATYTVSHLKQCNHAATHSLHKMKVKQNGQTLVAATLLISLL